MLTPSNRTITIASGGTALVGRTTAIGGGGGGGTVPTYITASTIMAKGLVPNSTNGPAGLNAYSGWVYAEGKFINPGFYGHQDGSDNAVSGIDVTVNLPTGWVELCAATPLGQRTSDAAYYADGKPSPPHGYQSTVYVPATREIWRMGKRFTYSNPDIPGSSTQSYPNIDIFSLASNSWRAATAPFASTPIGPVPNLPAQSGGAVINTAGFIFSGGLGFVTDPATGITRNRSGTGNSTSRYPQANNPDNNYILNFSFEDNGNGNVPPVVASIMVGETVSALTVNSSAAFTQLLADNPESAGLTWCRPRGTWLFYHGKAGRENTIYELTVNTTTKTLDVSILMITGGALATSVSAGVMNKFTYVDALGALFICTDVTVGIYFVRIA